MDQLGSDDPHRVGAYRPLGRLGRHAETPAGAAGPEHRTAAPGSTAEQPPAPALFAPPPPPPRRDGRPLGATVALIAVAVVVALGSGGSVYAFMKDGTQGKTVSPGPSGSASAEDGQPGEADTVPEDLLGTWSGSLSGEQGPPTRLLTTHQD
ncbi:hypothetical protein ACH4A3_24365 [Streptomyces sp. NPDC018007]|uniref:hypothetical protein n=1 Tax=Streptomyces sp. NPDC018007 TaxID=3365029 RepID=UPI0037A84AFB